MTPLLLAMLLATVPPPVVPTSPSGSAIPAPRLRTWGMDPAMCDGTVQTMTVPAIPRPAVTYASQAARAVAITFAIDGSGRPHAIRRDPAGPAYGHADDDLLPALAAGRFRPGPVRTRCTVRFAPQDHGIADAPMQAVYAATIPPVTIRIPALVDRIRPAGTTCDRPRPEPLLIAVPPFGTIPKTPGRAQWTVIRFDISARGRPVAITQVAGSGDAVIDRAARTAVADSRFAPRPRTACLRPFLHAAGTLAAPDTPADIKTPPAGATCPDGLAWTTPPVLRFPENYRRRAIEGWAALAFDVATWGQTGNVRILAAEPTADFGDAASRMVLAARKAPSSTGHTGCTVIVRYRIGTDTPAAPAPATAPPTLH